LTGLSVRGYLPSLVHPNTGNVGLPLCLFAFGEEGLALAIAYYVVNSLSQYVVTPCIASGGLSIHRLVRSPIIYAVGASLAFLLTDTTAPKWLNNATGLLGGMTIPLLLVTLGYSLARLKVDNLKISIGLSALRLAMGFGVGVAIAAVLGLEGAARGVAILQASMPVAILNYLFANQYNAEPEGVASFVVVSTIMSFVTLPLLLWYVL
jgi:predicted permease